MRWVIVLVIFLVSFCGLASAQSSSVTTRVQGVQVRSLPTAPTNNCTQHSGYFYFDDALHKLRVCEDGGTFTNFVGGGGAGNPGGSPTQVQFNSAGAFGGISSLTSNGTIVTQLVGADFVLADPTAPTKTATVDASGITAGQNRSVKLSDAAMIVPQPASAVSHQWLNSLNATTGLFGQSQPAAADLSDGTTGTGAVVETNSPTIVTPTIASFTNAQHNHTNAAGGGQITDAALSAPVGTAKGGTGTASTLTGIVRGGNPFTAAEISGDGSTSGSNALTVSRVNGISFSATAAAHTVPVITTANTTATYKTVPDCQDSAGNHLNYTQSTDLFSCGTTSSGGGGTPAGSTNDIQVNNAGAFGADTGALTWNLTTHLGLMKTSDSGTTNTPNTLEFYHLSSAAPAPGFGSGFLMTGDTNGGTRRTLGALYSVEDTATDASRSTHVSVQAVDTATAAADVARFGFVHNGGTPVAQVIAVGNSGQAGIPEFTAAVDNTTGMRVTPGTVWFQGSGTDIGDMNGKTFETDAFAVDFNNGDIAFRRESGSSAKISNRAGSTYQGLKLSTLQETGLTSLYNNITTAGWGHTTVYGNGRSAAQTAAVASVATYTVGAADGSFEVSANVLVTTSTTHSFTVTVAYTDEGNTARTLTLTFSQLTGTLLTAITNVQGTGAYEGVPLHIRCKASTSITIATTGTFTSVTYNVEGNIRQIA